MVLAHLYHVLIDNVCNNGLNLSLTTINNELFMSAAVCNNIHLVMQLYRVHWRKMANTHITNYSLPSISA